MESESIAKICNKCLENKLNTFFALNKRGKFGTRSSCKKCNSKGVKKSPEERAERRRKTAKAWRLLNRPRKTIDLPYKRCSCCEKVLPKTLDFFWERSSLGGFRSECKDCFGAKARLRHKQFYINNLEKEKERSRLTHLKFKDKRGEAEKKRNLEKPHLKKAYDARRIKLLPDSLIINRLRYQTGLSAHELRENKEIIESKRLIIQLKRTLKNK